MIFSKKGDIEVTVLITIIIAIVGFVIILFLFFDFDFGSYGEDEVCKLSVLSRATSPTSAQSAIPLKCSTKKLCLTKDGDCSKNFAGENPKVVKLSGSEDEIAKEIAKTSADAMLNCWKQMGEGKLDLFGSFWTQSGWEEAKPTCVICSRIAVDTSIGKDTLERVDINSYMKDNVIPELGVNYLSAFTGGGAISYAQSNENAFSKFAESSKSNIVLSESRENRELAIVFFQFKPPKYEEVLQTMAGIGGTVAGLAFIRPLVMNPVGGGLAIAGALGLGGYGMWNARQGQLAIPGYCGKFAGSRENIYGCSMVQGINYHTKDINELCPQIEGDF